MIATTVRKALLFIVNVVIILLQSNPVKWRHLLSPLHKPGNSHIGLKWWVAFDAQKN